MPVHQLLDDCQLTTVTGQKEAVQIFLHIECDIIKGDMLISIYVYISTTYPVPETGVKPSLLNEVSHHLEVALIHCLVETVLSKVVQVKPAVSKYGHEVLDNLQVASNSSKVESVQKVLHKIRVHVAIQINTNVMQTNSVQYHTGF